jgi:exodeoxyribonuclease V alpha subunit
LTRAPGSWIEEWYDQLIADEVLGDVQWRGALEFEAGRPSETAVARLDDLFEVFQQYQLLGVTRHRRRGVARLDVHLHRRHVARQRLPKADEFAVGEPVMMTRNDYERDLFNGDRGIILPVRDRDTGNEQKRAIFPRRSGYAAFALGPLRADLDHAWSITVHKSQGSEYDAVGLVLPDEHIALSTRELIYTGITRARHAVTFFGDPTRIRDAARETDERNTGLLERLGA